MMLIVTLAYRIVLEDGTQWTSKVDLARIQKDTAWGKLSIYATASIRFELCLEEPPEETGRLIVSRWSNRRAA